MKILLVNERVRHKNVLPSLGIAILAAIAKRRGHQVKAIDYQITTEAPVIYDYVEHLEPDVIGFRIVNESWQSASEKIGWIRFLVDKIIVGGPFPTLHYEELLNDDRIDAIFVGESELAFARFLVDLHNGDRRKIYVGTPMHGLAIPQPDFTTFHNYRAIRHYPLQLSRGCPYNCSFCATRFINTRKWRPLSLCAAIAEIRTAVKTFPNLKEIVIIDDNPTNDLPRFVEFLKNYRRLIQEEGAPRLSILNIRADKITVEIAKLLYECGCKRIILGVETTGKNAMKLLGKQIRPIDVINAKFILEQEGIVAGGSFIVGLPGDDWQTVNETIEFAKMIGLEYSLWGHLLPFKGTRVRKYVKVLNDYAETTVAPHNGEIIKGTGSETRELPQRWQIKGWLRGSIVTNPHSVFTRWNPIPTFKIFLSSIRYAEVHTLARYGIRFLGRWVAGRELDPRKFFGEKEDG